jgi:hypothetical protein
MIVGENYRTHYYNDNDWENLWDFMRFFCFIEFLRNFPIKLSNRALIKIPNRKPIHFQFGVKPEG